MTNRHPCVGCGRLIYVGFQRCGDCANTPPHLTTHGLRRLHEQAGTRPQGRTDEPRRF